MSAERQTQNNTQAETQQTDTQAETQEITNFSRSDISSKMIQRARSNPQTLTPKQVLQLQRTVGNRTVARLITQKSQSVTPAKPAATEQAIQRKIGFEIETGIPAKNLMDDDTYEDPDYEDFNIELADGSRLDIDSNPNGGGKILEFASAPVDDKQESDTFRNTATQWLGFLTNLRVEARKSPPLKRLKDKVPEAPGYARIGVEEGKTPDAMDRTSIQTTHGLRLDKVRTFLTNMSLENKTGASRVTAKEQAANEAADAIEPVMAEVTKKFDPTTMPKVTERQVEELRGFFTLMTHYMLAGKYVASGYNKNRAALFYKSKLSDVRNKLVAQNRYAKAVLTDAETVNKVAIILLIATKRKKDEGLYTGTENPTCWDWMVNIFNGTDDLAFESSKNPWGKDIKPDKVNGRLAAVVEHRDIDKVVPPPGSLKLTDPGTIVDYLTTIFEANKEWEGIDK